jgi:uncharacterized FAD-dependent dehydrogenase
MCPGGTVVAATSEAERVVTNGMSQYSRNERNANAGIVVAINPEPDFPGGPLAGVALQEALESTAYVLGGSDYCAPGQLVGDFLRASAPQLSGVILRHAGVRLGDHRILPATPSTPCRACFRQTDRLRSAAPVLTGVEPHLISYALRVTQSLRKSQCAQALLR